MNKNLERFEEEIHRCSKCGTCRSVCPVFAETLTEAQVARGKIALAGAALDHSLDVSRVMSDRMTLCLNCKSCVENCPAEVRVDEIILAARDRLHREGKNPFLKHAFIDLIWTRGRVFTRFMQAAGRLESLLIKKKEGGGGRSRVSLPGLDPDRTVPILDSQSLLSRLPEIILPETRSRMRVGLLLGCATNWVYPSIGESTIRILANAEMEVVIPKDQECCGVPMLNAGDFERAAAQRSKNRSAFAKHEVDVVVTACASCGLALKKEMDEILEGGAYFPNIPVYDLSEFLAKEVKTLPTGSLEPFRVTYHDPCHLNRGQGITAEPRQLIESVQGIDLVEMAEADRCCGGGGLFSLSHYDVAMGIGSRKAESILETSADVVVTSCPACMLQLTDVLGRTPAPPRVIHIAELLAKAL